MATFLESNFDSPEDFIRIARTINSVLAKISYESSGSLLESFINISKEREVSSLSSYDLSVLNGFLTYISGLRTSLDNINLYNDPTALLIFPKMEFPSSEEKKLAIYGNGVMVSEIRNQALEEVSQEFQKKVDFFKKSFEEFYGVFKRYLGEQNLENAKYILNVLASFTLDIQNYSSEVWIDIQKSLIPILESNRTNIPKLRGSINNMNRQIYEVLLPFNPKEKILEKSEKIFLELYEVKDILDLYTSFIEEIEKNV